MSQSFLSSITNHYAYLKYFIKHKWVVFKYCCKLGVVWRGIAHDLSKLLPDEWFPYVKHFYGVDKFKRSDKPDFRQAVGRHYERNDHHAAHWTDEDWDVVLDMPDDAVREMVADWHGAAIVQGKQPSSVWRWYYVESYDNLRVSALTRTRINTAMLDLGYLV